MSLKEVSDKLNKISHCTSTYSENSISLELSTFTGIRFIIDYKNNSNPTIYFFCKTTSWQYEGCRTDLHDVISLIFSIYLNLSEISFSFQILHTGTFLTEDTEIGNTYCIANQIGSDLLGDITSDELLERIEELLFYISAFEYFFLDTVGCPCPKCHEDSNLDSFFSFKINPQIEKKIKNTFSKLSNQKNSFSRKLPTWEYYRDFKKDMSIIYNSELTFWLKSLYSLREKKVQEVSSINGVLYTNGDLKNYINKSIITFIRTHLKKLEKGKNSTVLIIPLENVVIGIGEEYIIAKGTKSGIEQFKIERERLRKRHQLEAELIFPVTKFIWSEKIDGARFESLIKELLENEKGFISIRKSGLTNEGDNGRDLIAYYEKNIPPLPNSVDENLVIKQIKVVVQCKAYNKPINKGVVKDIRDTIEYHKSEGYFLVTSSYITNSLVSHLESLQDKFEYIDWWTRDEIESRLKNNKDILLKYSDVVISKT